MRTQKSREGYLMVDHRASPGLPPEVARACGYDPVHAGEGGFFEVGTLTCSHCKLVQHKNPLRTRERASCSKCGYHYVCDYCAAAMLAPDYSHQPFEKLVEDGLTLRERGLILNTTALGTPLGSPLKLLGQPEPPPPPPLILPEKEQPNG